MEPLERFELPTPGFEDQHSSAELQGHFGKYITMKTLREYVQIVENAVLDRPPVTAKQETPYDCPGGATVMILNDDKTPYEVVVEAIVAGTGMPPREAFDRMMRAHSGGWAPVASYASVDLADTVASKIMAHAKQNTKYDEYRKHPHFKGFTGPWPLYAEVMDAQQ